jgi:hypothetical protein
MGMGEDRWIGVRCGQLLSVAMFGYTPAMAQAQAQVSAAAAAAQGAARFNAVATSDQAQQAYSGKTARDLRQLNGD